MDGMKSSDHSGTPSASPKERDEAICEVEGCGDWLRCLTHGVTFSRVGDMPASCADTTWMTPRALAARQRRAASVSVSEEGSATPKPVAWRMVDGTGYCHRVDDDLEGITGDVENMNRALASHCPRFYLEPLYLASGIPTGSQSSATLDEADLQFVPEAQPRGGQHVGSPKGLTVIHRPSGVGVFCTAERSQLRNKIEAMRLLGVLLASRLREGSPS